MSQPIAFKTIRYRCPHCPRIGSSKARVTEHIGRCWHNPEARGCKTCAHFNPAWGESPEPDIGYGGYYEPENCEVGISLAGRPACAVCNGANWLPTGETFQPRLAKGGPVYAQCTDCGGDGAERKPGPIVGCDRWVLAESESDES